MLPRAISFVLALPLSLSALACSDPPPTPAAGGVDVMLGPPAASVAMGRGCNAGTSGAFTYVIGQPNPGKTIEDGTHGVTVACTIKANGDFDASIKGVDGNGKKPVSFSFTGSVKDQATPASNTSAMTFFSPDTGHMNTLADFPPCTIGPVVTYKAGAMLTDVDCPLIGVTDDSVSGCKVHGTIAFEYCKTGEEQD
jgi:hypothetical protein